MKTEPASKNNLIPKKKASCPCGSGKKYKRCCGQSVPTVEAQPLVTIDKNEIENDLPPLDPNSVPPEILAQFTQAFKRLPKAQLNQFQRLIVEGMQGKPIDQQLKSLQKKLPKEFQELLSQSTELDQKPLDSHKDTASDTPSDLTPSSQWKRLWSKWTLKK